MMAYQRKTLDVMIKKTAKKKKPTLKTIPQLEKELWTIFSLAVRLQWADKKGDCTCVTCGFKSYYHGGNIHAGHFRPRSAKAVKYDFKNVHPQCATCNTYNDGEQFLHGKWIDNQYGPGTADELTRLSRLSIRDLGNTRSLLEEKKSECLDILANYLHFVEWQSNVNKTTLKEIQCRVK